MPPALHMLVQSEDEEMNKLPSEEGGGFHDEVLQKYTGGVMAAISTLCEQHAAYGPRALE